ncbi:glycosyltransferase family 8 protein [Cohnella boryungensis]|uniref:Glycosyltransferase family 8 protein n=1 Tax=Cohnella boryungensis TaxID=768479 RepID=A0ABV8S7E8_9BACL
MTKQETIHIVATSDTHYVQHLGVALKSLAIHLSARTNAVFHVAHDGLPEHQQAQLRRTLDGTRTELRLVPLDRSLFEGLPISRHLNEATYFKLAVPEIVASLALEKVIYLDCDVVVNCDIRPLWDMELGDYALAAVSDPGGRERLADLGISAEAGYFNAGVLLFNLRKWQSRSLSRQVIEAVVRAPDKMQFHDQDGLNAVLYRDWLELPARWNMQTNMVKPEERGLPAPPCILHYTGSSKPWHYGNDHPYKRVYFAYLAMTAWSAYRPERSLAAGMKAVTRKLLPRPAIAFLSKMKSLMANG